MRMRKRKRISGLVNSIGSIGGREIRGTELDV